MSKISRRGSVLLLILLVVAFFLRFFRLDLDSFWLDELYVAREADPHQSLHYLFAALRSYDQHPPLFYLAERCFLFFFPESETTARILPAAAGVASIYAMYLLGREILNERLGLVAAAITCVNHFHIHYSREARGYMFAFLFSALSLVYLLRLIKQLRGKDVLLFSFFALLTMYSHYFGVLLVFSEFCAAGIVFIGRKDKGLFAGRFALSGLIIAAGYAVWLPVLLALGKIKSFWILPLPGDWPLRYFSYYFGETPGLAYLMAALMVICFVGAFRRPSSWPITDRAALKSTVVILGMTALLCYLIPFIRGLIVTPMLTDRYTIVALPCLLLFAAYGIELLPAGRIRYGVLGFLFVFSIAGEIGFLHTWSRPHKTDFRGITAFMAADPGTNHYPIICERVADPESYYTDKLNYPGPLLGGARDKIIDSLCKQPAAGFWLMDAHRPADPLHWADTATQRKVDSLFIKVKELRSKDAWTQLYVRRPAAVSP